MGVNPRRDLFCDYKTSKFRRLVWISSELRADRPVVDSVADVLLDVKAGPAPARGSPAAGRGRLVGRGHRGHDDGVAIGSTRVTIGTRVTMAIMTIATSVTIAQHPVSLAATTIGHNARPVLETKVLFQLDPATRGTRVQVFLKQFQFKCDISPFYSYFNKMFREYFNKHALTVWTIFGLTLP